jgi:peptidoglycan/xylan/chitin deacetylase (PgdA/CDA1 family)
MEYLRRNYHIVSLDQIIGFVNKRHNLPTRSVAITFDDGYHDNYVNAYPYLKKHGLPAAIFVTTGYCRREIPLDGLRLEMLDWDEIKEMSRNRITIGAHTITHRNLQQMHWEEARHEILKSKQEIEKKIESPVNYFAYPNYRSNAEIVHLVRSLGFRAAFNGGRGRLIRRGDDPFVLSRISIDSSVTFLMFRARLTKAVEWYSRFEDYMERLVVRPPFLGHI